MPETNVDRGERGQALPEEPVKPLLPPIILSTFPAPRLSVTFGATNLPKPTVQALPEY